MTVLSSLSRGYTNRFGTPTWGRAGAFALQTIGVSALFPGSLAENISSSLGFEAGYRWFGHQKPTGKRWLYGFVGGGIARLGASAIGAAFSGFDDNYNTIEGLKHGGFAEGVRKRFTDFGSGYQGLPSSLMGVAIDPSILSFRANVLDDPAEKKALEARLKERQAEAVEGLGTFTKEDFVNSNLSAIEGLNLKNQNLREINLEKFAISVDDADTLLLKRKGLFNLFADPIQIRLSGIDAPEVAGHSNDPMEEIRIWNAQAGGEAATEGFKDILARQKNLRLVVDMANQTYGRSLGVLAGEQGENIHLQMLREGLVSALPFGPTRTDIISRSAAAQAESEAVDQERGIWSLARYKAIREATGAIGNPITHNVLTEINKLAGNLNLGAYGSFLQSFGEEQGQLTSEEIATAQRLGRALKKTHGQPRFSGRGRAYNTIEGVHPGSESMGAESVRAHSEFGSGWDPLRKIANEIFGANKGSFEKLLKSGEFKKAVSEGLTTSGKLLGKGSMGQSEVWGYSSRLVFGEKTYPIEFALKKASSGQSLTEMAQRTKELATEYRSLGALGAERAPSVYGYAKDFGLADEAIIMERLNLGASLKDRPLSSQEISAVESFVGSAHKRGITHTDLHSENIVRAIIDPETRAEEIAVIDWGLANRFQAVGGIGGHQSYMMKTPGAQKIFAKISEETGSTIRPREFSEIADMLRLRSYRAEGSRAEKLAINAPYLHRAAEENYNVLKQELKTLKGDPTVTPQRLGLTQDEFRQAVAVRVDRERLLEETAQSIAAFRRGETFLQESTLSVAELGLAKTYQAPWAARTEVLSQENIELTNQAVRRNKRFTERATSSVGAGLKQAHNAGKRHSRFASLGKLE